MTAAGFWDPLGGDTPAEGADVRVYEGTAGNGVDTSVEVIHGLNATTVDVEVWDTSVTPPERVGAVVRELDPNIVRIDCYEAPATDSLKVLALGTGFPVAAADSITLAGTLPGLSATGSKWAGAALSSVSGKVYAVPFTGASSVLVIDPTTDTVSQVGTVSSTHVGLVEGDDGRLYAAPENGGPVLVIDPTDDSVSDLTAALGGSQGWYHGAKADTGAIYFAPVRSSTAVLKIVPETELVTQVGSGLSIEWGGPVLADTGDIYIPPRTTGGTILKVEPDTDTVSEIGSSLSATSRAWATGVRDPSSGRIYFTPKQETRILVIDPADDSTYYIEGIASGDDKYFDGIAHGGLLYFFPRTASNVLVVDPADDSVTTVGFDTTGFGTGDRWVGAVKVGNFVYSIPFDSTAVAKWELHR